MAPDLEELNKELQGKAIILFVDIGKNQSFASGYPIRVIPTQLLITNDGKPFIALLAGLLTSITPCSLSSVPLVFGYVGGAGNKDTKRSFKLSLVFAFGTSITFTVLGILVSFLGRIMQGMGQQWYIMLGVLMVLMALQTWDIFSFIPSTYLVSKNKKRGYIGALFAGILGGVFSSPCSTPVLVVLLGIVAQSSNVVWGILLLLLYSVGHSILVLIAEHHMGLHINWRKMKDMVALA